MNMTRTSLSCIALAATAAMAQAEETKIVSWNIGAAPIERILARADDFRRLDSELSPDVIVLVELTGLDDLRAIASALDWPTYYAAVSDMTLQQAEIHFALEVGVISKIPITAVTEHDAGPDRRTHPVLTNSEPDGDESIPVTEAQLKGAPNMGVGRTDRGTLQVDLENGLTLFPVHLKSNSNDVCFAVSDAQKALVTAGVSLPPELEDIFQNGSALKAQADAENAQKRERVIAAVKLVADGLVERGRQAIIAGDYNTSYEPGKVGSTIADCALQAFSCKKAPFPASACSGDGFDDTFAMLTVPLAGGPTWDVLTAELGSTYDNDAFADRAIDHISVPSTLAESSSDAGKGDETFGSDHYPVFVTITH